MAHVYMKNNKDECIGIEKLSNSDVYRSFKFKKEDLGAICTMLTESGHNYNYIESNSFGEKRHVRSKSHLSKKIFLFSFLIGCFISIPMLILELLTNFGFFYIAQGILYFIIRVVIVGLLASFAMFYSDTKPIEKDLNWSAYVQYDHYPLRNRHTYFIITKPLLCSHELVTLICVLASLLIIAPIYIFTIKPLTGDYELGNILIFILMSILLSFSTSFAFVYGIGTKSVNFINKYENIPKL